MRDPSAKATNPATTCWLRHAVWLSGSRAFAVRGALWPADGGAVFSFGRPSHRILVERPTYLLNAGDMATEAGERRQWLILSAVGLCIIGVLCGLLSVDSEWVALTCSAALVGWLVTVALMPEIIGTKVLRAVRVESSRRLLVLSGYDIASATQGLLGVWVGFAVIFLALFALHAPWWLYGTALVPAAALFGCRVQVRVTATTACIERRVLWWWVWRRQSLAEPQAWVDGWGDVLDPEVLNVGQRWSLENDGVSVELGWSSANSGDLAERLASEFNSGVRMLRSEKGRH